MSRRVMMMALAATWLMTTGAVCDEEDPWVNCYALGVEDCGSEPTKCEISKSARYDNTNACWPEEQEVGCRPRADRKDVSCGDRVFYALDGNGACWRHVDDCGRLAAGHTNTSYDGAKLCGLDSRSLSTPCAPE